MNRGLSLLVGNRLHQSLPHLNDTAQPFEKVK